ncbi:MAG TPA: hypothetical protein VFL13_01345, partial [Candidatus Baltobacteraceae bacterium]|nr:hypothetical protein [Candidatus Baltobacteraceae bacterium]
LPVRGVSGDRIVSARATRVFPAPKAATPLKFWTEDVPLALSLVLAAFLGYRRPGIMIAALILFIGGGGINWNRVAAAVTSWPDWLLSLTCKPLALVCTIFPVLVLASFAIRLPGDEPSPEKRRVIRIVDSVVILGFVVEGMPYSATLSAIYLVFSALLVIAAAVLSLRYARPVDRARVAVVFAAVMIGGVGYAADMLVAIFVNLGPWYGYYATMSAIIVPLALAYAILRHKVFDVAFVLNRTIVYGLTSTFLIVLLAALEFLAERYIVSFTRVESIAVEFAIALAVIVSARVAHQRIDQAVDRVLFRTRHQQEEALRRFATTAQFYTAQDPLIRDTVEALERFGRVQGAAVYLARGEDLRCERSSFPHSAAIVNENDPASVCLRAHREELDTHEMTTAFPGSRLYPMVLAGRLAGTLVTGDRENGEAIPPDIDEAIQRVAAAVGIALAAIDSDLIRAENANLRRQLNVQIV